MFDFMLSLRHADERLNRASKRRRRSDAGKSRLNPVVLAELRALVLGMERPSMLVVQRHIAEACRERGLRPPSRASLYNALSRLPGHTYHIPLLPRYIRETLYNLAPDAEVPGHQLVFYCLNYGSLAAASYASGLPWLDLYQAWHLRGWRPRSRGLLEAAMRQRGIK
jgi:hypothetical protein